jgi:phospholipase C
MMRRVTDPGEAPATRREFLAVTTALAMNAVPIPGHRGHHNHRRHKHEKKHHERPLDQVEHVVIVMQENCSFDRYLGTLSGVRGFSDPHALTLSTGRSVFYQPSPAPPGYLLPWHLDTASFNPCEIPIDNGWNPMHAALDAGKMDGWVSGENPYSMSYYTRADLPWHMALADAFTVADGYYASVLGPTNPNRLVSMTGTIDPAGRGGGPVIDNSEATPYTWTTYPERLQAKGISWRVYQQDDNFDDNALAWFKAYQQAQPGSPLYENGMRRRSVDAFAIDVASGNLPQVSWLIAPTAQSEHPGYAPGPGADFCAGVVEALFAHLDVWANTVLILTYDEPGGFFDHVVPPLPPAGSPDEFVDGAPIGLGFRVPTVVCSPWSRGGLVCSHTYDHTSTIRFLERRFGVVEPQISAWRRRTCGDLIRCLDFTRKDMSIPKLPPTSPLASASQQACQLYPPAAPQLVLQQMPTQEPGTKRHR